MVDSELDLVLVFNGAIYNYRELRRELASHGYPFRTQGDTEVVLAAYHAWGADCARRLNGIFAFAVWDAARESLFLARDPLGARGLAYYADVRRFVAASDIKQILAHPTVRPELNEAKVAQYLAVQWEDQEQTFYQSIFYCPPAHCMLVTRDSLRKWRYWDLDPGRRLPYGSDAEYAEAFLALLDDAVDCRMRSAHKIGVSLSGGLDSAAVTALAAGGLAFLTASNRAAMLSTSFSVGKLTLPMGTCKLAVLSTRNSTRPALASSIRRGSDSRS